MSFTTLQFLLFLTVTAVLCYKLKPKARNVLLLIANFVFYALYGIEHLPFLLAATLLTYFAALLIEREALGKRKLWLVLALCLNLGMLFTFKYLGFFTQLGQRALNFLDVSMNVTELQWILPVGISFYVFQTTGYLMDVYRKKLPAERSFVDFALFASFFPGLVSGPIQRAGDMLPQYKSENKFDYENIKSGTLQFLWGAFKKLVIADRLAVLVNSAYAQPADFSGFQLLVAALCYSIQIYCDFSAYSDMAIGSARAMGFRVMTNFDSPYFAASMQEFWRRWHISLSTWFRDYLYFPLGGNRKGKWRGYLNIVIVFLVSGLWHGAALTFIVWGLLHGLFQVFGKILEPLRDKIREGLHISKDNRALRIFKVLFTFMLVTIAWVFFRADSLTEAVFVLKRIFTSPLTYSPICEMGLSCAELVVLAVSTTGLFAADWAQNKYALSKRINESYVPRGAVYFILLAAIMLFGHYGAGFDPMDFVYFKF